MSNSFDAEEKQALMAAIPLQVHRKSSYPNMTAQLGDIFAEVVAHRAAKKQQIRKANRIKKHLDVLILDLWVAANYYPSPWRMVSRNKTDFQKETRYRKIYLKYDLFVGVLDNLISLGYINQKKGFFDQEKGKGFQTRIKASNKLLTLEFDIAGIVRDPDAPEEETIIKKDKDGKLIDYVDDIYSNEGREFLRGYNTLLRNTTIGTDTIDLRYKHDPTRITVKQIFKEEGGGRFYGGFWQTMPKLDRLKLLLGHGEVCELDYAAIHPTIAYAFKGIELTEDPYIIEGCHRSDVKKAFLVLFNCDSRKQAINTVQSFGIKNTEQLIESIEQKHEAIKSSFYNPGFGMVLQNTDAWLAEKIIKKMMQSSIVCLPVHDSFICLKIHEAALHTAMEESFIEAFNIKPRIK